jgi:hypothetical protein
VPGTKNRAMSPNDNNARLRLIQCRAQFLNHHLGKTVARCGVIECQAQYAITHFAENQFTHSSSVSSDFSFSA